MNKSQLIDFVANDAEISKEAAKRSIDSFTNAVTATLKNGESLALVGFGTFSATARPERTGRNPQTGETLVIPARNVPSFKAGKALKDAINPK